LYVLEKTERSGYCWKSNPDPLAVLTAHYSPYKPSRLHVVVVRVVNSRRLYAVVVVVVVVVVVATVVVVVVVAVATMVKKVDYSRW
jgi:hypothetical protein